MKVLALLLRLIIFDSFCGVGKSSRILVLVIEVMIKSILLSTINKILYKNNSSEVWIQFVIITLIVS